MTAQEILKQTDPATLVSEKGFYLLVKTFQKAYLLDTHYAEKLSSHRHPIEVKHEMLANLNRYILDIQQRVEMIDHRPEQNTFNYIPTIVKDLWKEDKRIKSLYCAIQVFCGLNNKDFNVIAVHIAEYRAMNKLYSKISLSIYKNTKSKPQTHTPKLIMNKIKVINDKSFVDSMSALNDKKNEFVPISAEDFEMIQFETQPLEGYEMQAGYPYCCDNHKSLYEGAKEKFELFPDCCKDHKKLLSTPWFRKEDYNYMPLKVVNVISYTWDCILKCINNDNWFKEITDYVQHSVNSFGQLPTGFGSPVVLSLYLSNLRSNIEKAEEIPAAKKEQLTQFLNDHYDKEPAVEQTDLNLLVSTYRKWLSIFPFELSYFKDLRPYFEHQLPILKGPGQTNMYSGMTAIKLHTKNELISFLASATLKIIQEINAVRLYKEGFLTEVQSTQLEILIAKRKLELESLDKKNWEDRKEYIKLLKEWFAGEKSFLSELKKLNLKDSPGNNFIGGILSGMKLLQQHDINEPCIVNIKSDLPGKETGFQYWFKMFFTARFRDAVVTAEEEKGNGRIDLKLYSKELGTKIIEFKGWWNRDKNTASEQLCSYLTDFEKEGYIIMINDSKTKNIYEDYQKIVMDPAMQFIPGSLLEHSVPDTQIIYFETRHKFSVNIKTVFHFIFNVYSSNSFRNKVT